MRDKVLKGVAGFTAAFAVIGLFTWAVGWQRIIAVYARSSTSLLFLGGLLGFTSLTVLGVAWWVVVREIAEYGVLGGLRVFFATQFANFVTPLGQFGGEPFIAYILSHDSEIAIEDSFGAVFAADLLNTVQFFTLSFLGILVFLIYFPLSPLVSFILKVILLLVGLLVGGLAFLWKWKNITLGLLGWTGEKMERIMGILNLENGYMSEDYMVEKGERFYTTMEELLNRPAVIVKTLILSHLSGFLGVAGLYLVILSLGIDAPVSAILFVMPASMLAGYLPLPGGLGGIEVAMAGLLTAVAGVPLPVASASALAFRVFTYWAALLIGGYFISHMSVDIFS